MKKIITIGIIAMMLVACNNNTSSQPENEDKSNNQTQVENQEPAPDDEQAPEEDEKEEEVKDPFMITLGDLDIDLNAIVPQETLDQLNIVELRTLRNAIYARYGYDFETVRYKNYFLTQDWYQPTSKDVNDQITVIDQRNVRYIQKAAVAYERQAAAYLIPVVKSVGPDRVWAYINYGGQVILDYQYLEADEYRDGVAVINVDGKYGIIDMLGNYIIEPTYDSIKYISDATYHYSLEVGGAYESGLLDLYGNTYPSDTYINHAKGSQGLYLVEDRTSQKFGYVDFMNQEVIPAIYERAGIFVDGLAPVVNADKLLGYIDSSGQVVIPFKYTPDEGMIDENEFSHGLAKVVLEGNTLYIDAIDDIKINIGPHPGSKFSDGLAHYYKDGQVTVIEPSSLVRYTFDFTYVSDYHNGFAVATLGDLDGSEYGLIDAYGRFVSDQVYKADFNHESSPNSHWTQFDGYSARLLDAQGNLVVVTTEGQQIWIEE